MANGDNIGERPPDFRSEVIEKMSGVAATGAIAQGANWLLTALVNAADAVIGAVLRQAAKIGGFIAKRIVAGEDRAQDAFGDLAAIAVEDVFGVKVSPRDLNARGERGRRSDASRAIGAAILQSLTSGGASGGGGTLQPSAAGAEQYLSAVTQIALEGWLEGWIIEACTLGQLEQFGELDDIMAQVLGLGRMSRRVVGPLLNARVITPFQWQVNKTYRPELLSTSEVARQVARGRWSREKGVEELARQGWSDERIEALFNSVAKFHSVADLDLLVRAGLMSRDGALQHLRDQGYDESVARTELELERLKRIATFERQLGTAAVTAYVDRRIDRSMLMRFVNGHTIDDQEAAQILEIADARRALNTKSLSPGETRAAVKARILSVRDYRDALLADGYDEQSALTLELLLRHELEEQADIEELRRRQADERAAEKRQREAERAAKKAELEEARRLARRGDESDLERAVIRGLVPIARYVEVIAPRYDSDTVSIMRELVEDARIEYVERAAAAEAARLRAQSRGIGIGALQTAVLEGVLTLDRFASHPDVQQLAPADRSILLDTLRERLDDRRDAEKVRAEAEAAARRRQVNLGRFETLVRRGHRTLAQYSALLRSLDLSDAAAAVNRDYLELLLADDKAARDERERIERELRNKGLSLEQFRRAAILGQKTPADYTAFLQAQGYGADVQRLLGAELTIDIQEADAARRRRDEAERVVEASRLPLAVLHRAARLGVVSPTAYQTRLRQLGYTDDDIAIETDLLLIEIADVQLARASGRALDPAIALDEARLAAELEARRAALLAGDDPRALSLAQLEKLTLEDLKSVDQFYADVVGLGYGEEDAELLTVLVWRQLEKKATKAAGG